MSLKQTCYLRLLENEACFVFPVGTGRRDTIFFPRQYNKDMRAGRTWSCEGLVYNTDAEDEAGWYQEPGTRGQPYYWSHKLIHFLKPVGNFLRPLGVFYHL